MTLWMAEGGPVFNRRLSVGQSAHPVQFTSADYTDESTCFSATFHEQLPDYSIRIPRRGAFGPSRGSVHFGCQSTPGGSQLREVDLNQSQGGMCIYNTSVIGLGFSQKSFGL